MSTNGNGSHSGLDVQKRTYTTRSGRTFHLRPINPMILSRFQVEMRKTEPRIPLKVVSYGKDRWGEEPDPESAAYLQAHEIWDAEKNAQQLEFVFSLGIADDPPATDALLDATEDFFPDRSPRTRKYDWVCQFLQLDMAEGEDAINEIEELSEAILGQSVVTQDGLEQAKAEFPGTRRVRRK